MRLYHAPGSCSQAVHIVLRELGLDIDIVKVDPRKHVTEDGRDYYDVAELGYVPLLELDDGTCLREGPVIAQFLADQRPEAGLAPAHGTMERYRLLEWLNFLTAEIHKGFIPLLYAGLAGKYVEPARKKLDSRYAWTDRQLAGRTFLLGDTFTHCGCVPVRADGLGQGGVDAFGVQRGHRPWRVSPSRGMVRAGSAPRVGAAGAGGGRAAG